MCNTLATTHILIIKECIFLQTASLKQNNVLESAVGEGAKNYFIIKTNNYKTALNMQQYRLCPYTGIIKPR